MCLIEYFTCRICGVTTPGFVSCTGVATGSPSGVSNTASPCVRPYGDQMVHRYWYLCPAHNGQFHFSPHPDLGGPAYLDWPLRNDPHLEPRDQYLRSVGPAIHQGTTIGGGFAQVHGHLGASTYTTTPPTGASSTGPSLSTPFTGNGQGHVLTTTASASTKSDPSTYPGTYDYQRGSNSAGGSSATIEGAAQSTIQDPSRNVPGSGYRSSSRARAGDVSTGPLPSSSHTRNTSTGLPRGSSRTRDVSTPPPRSSSRARHVSAGPPRSSSRARDVSTGPTRSASGVRDVSSSTPPRMPDNTTGGLPRSASRDLSRRISESPSREVEEETPPGAAGGKLGSKSKKIKKWFGRGSGEDPRKDRGRGGPRGGSGAGGSSMGTA